MLIQVPITARWPLYDVLTNKGWEYRSFDIHHPYIQFINPDLIHSYREARGNSVIHFNRRILSELMLLPKEAIELFIHETRLKPGEHV